MPTAPITPVATLTAFLLAAGPAVAGNPAASTPTTPEATVWVSSPRPQVGEPFFLQIEVGWSGEPDRLLPHPPRLELPASWKAGALAASTRMDDGRSVVLYRIELAASEPGTFRLAPAHIRWTPRDSAPSEGLEPPGLLPQSLAVELPEVTVHGPRAAGLISPASPPSAASLPGSTPPVGAAILALLLTAGALLLRRIRSRLRVFSAERRHSEHAQARREELLRQAVHLRRSGYPTEAVQVLGQILRELDTEGPLTASRLEEMRYGGNPPRSEELEGLESRVRRELEARAPRPERPDKAPRRSGRVPGSVAVPSAVPSSE